MTKVKFVFDIAWVAVLVYFVMQLLRCVDNFNVALKAIGR